MLKPADTAELADAINAGKRLRLQGRGTKLSIGRPVDAEDTLDLSRFSGVETYEPDELILAARAATPLSEISKLLAQRGQQLAFEPPDLSRLLGSAHAGTFGGALVCNLAGPRRIKAGAARDHILEVSGVSGRGEAFHGGARVVKNVTGYDVPKLMAHSWGTLAAITSLCFKVLPAAETEESVALSGLGSDGAVRAMAAAMQSSCEVSGAAHVPAEKLTLLRLEGISASVTYRRERLIALLRGQGEVAVLKENDSRRKWIGIRDVHPLADGLTRAVWRLSVPPADGARVFAEIEKKLDVRGLFDWGGGLIWLDCPATEDCGAGVIRGALKGGHATLIRAPESARREIEVFQPLAPGLAALAARVKAAFDPLNRLNPGLMWKGV